MRVLCRVAYVGLVLPWVTAADQVTKYVPLAVDAPAGGGTESLELMVPSQGSHQIANPADLFKHVGNAWKTVVESNQAGLVDPKQMHLAAQDLSEPEAWHHFQAGRNGVVDSGRFLITFNMVPAVQSGGSPLHIAAAMGAVARMEALLEDGADVDEEKLEDGTTPLHQAVTTCKGEAVQLLVEKGANIGAIARSGATPLHMAAAIGCVPAARILLESGADADYKHAFAGTTALHFASEMGRVGVISELCKRGADPNAEKVTGGTPLHSAADSNQSAAVELLLSE
eukprot:Hpha_TRINITY_DN3001_c0_g2::TRINITY_DN3001_c0_g2_i1::g.138619::m.138619